MPAKMMPTRDLNVVTDKGKGAQQMIPTVIGATSSAALEKLDRTQQSTLDKLITEQAEYIDHPMFTRPIIELKLFGTNAEEVLESTSRFDASALSDLGDLETIQVGTMVLTAEQERILFLRFNLARYRVYKLLEKHNGKRMPLAVIREMLAWHEKAQEIRSQITQANVPLVLAMAKRTRLNAIDFSDLVSEGNLALLRSVDKFDVSRGFKFSTYACRAILKAFSRVAMKASQYRGRFPTEFDPALERSDHSERKRDEFATDCADELRAILNRNLAGLTDVEHTVISARFSLVKPKDTDALPTMTLEEVGKLIGVTKERVRQIQKKAMNKIRSALEEQIFAG